MRARATKARAAALAVAMLLAATTAAAADTTTSDRAVPSQATLRFERRAAQARLTITTSAARSFVSVRFRGRSALAGGRWRIALVRCAGRRCRTVRGITSFALRGARGQLDRVVRIPRSAVVQVRLRRDGRTFATALLVGVPPRTQSRPKQQPQPAPQPQPLPAPQPQPQPAPQPPAPTGVALTTQPPLVPAYSADVPDYTVACEPSGAVDVTTSVGAGAGAGGVALDGAALPAGETTRTLPLASGQAFTFTAAGRTHSVRCTPSDFPRWSVERAGTPQTDFFAFTPTLDTGARPYTVIADDHGVPLWWMRTARDLPSDAQVLADGTVAWGYYLGGTYTADGRYDRYSLGGEALGAITTVGVGTDGHDLRVLPGGNRLVLSYVPRDGVDLSSLGGPASARVLDAVVQEVTPAGGLVWSWNSKDHIALAETASFGLASARIVEGGGDVYDLAHINSVEEAGDELIVSLRHTDAVYAIDRSDGAVAWKLGGTPRAESLVPLGDPVGADTLGGQHDARLLADGTVTIHDNGTGAGRPPRALRWAIDRAAGTATLLEQVSDARVSASNCCGSARRLPGGDWLMSWGGVNTITELTPAGAPVLTLTLDRAVSYRAQPVPAGSVTRQQLRAGMDAQHPR